MCWFLETVNLISMILNVIPNIWVVLKEHCLNFLNIKRHTWSPCVSPNRKALASACHLLGLGFLVTPLPRPEKWWETYIPSGEPNIAGWIIPMFNRKYTCWKVPFYNAGGVLLLECTFFWSSAGVQDIYKRPYRLSTSITITNGCYTVQIHWNKCKYIICKEWTYFQHDLHLNLVTSNKRHILLFFPVNCAKPILVGGFNPFEIY